MSKENDKVNNINDSVPVNNIPANPENNETPSNNLNINPSNPVPNQQDVKPGVRKNMVSKATDFLTAERIRNTSIERKVNFLRSRGLTDHEIQLSLQQAAAMYNDTKNFYVNSPLPNPSAVNYLKTSGVADGSESWLRRLVGSVAIGATAVYICYQIYKKYLENWLFGMKMSPVEKRLEIVELLVQRCIMLIEEKNITPEGSTEQNNRQKELDQVRAELKSIKSLLLNRFQFPPAPASSSIPQWQLVKNPKPQAEPQNKINGNDTSNSSPMDILNRPNSTTVVPQIVDILDSDTVKDKDTKLNNFGSNGITLPLNSDQHVINRHNEVIQNNYDKHNGDNGDQNQ